MTKQTIERTATVECQVRADDGNDRVLRFIASTDRVARDGDVIDAAAWKTDNFLRSHPAFLWSHDPSIPPIGRAIALERIVDGPDPRLEVSVEFDDSEFADRIFRLYKKGFLRSVSVGFIVHDWREPSDDEREERGLGPNGHIITEAELLEVSAVAVPSDPGAVKIDPRGVRKSDVFSIRSYVADIDVWRLDALADRCEDSDCGCGDRSSIRGSRLAALLNRLIKDKEDDETTRADVIASMASAAGISTGTVNQILDGDINCPPRERLSGFAKALGSSANALVAAARSDGCTYGDDDRIAAAVEERLLNSDGFRDLIRSEAERARGLEGSRDGAHGKDDWGLVESLRDAFTNEGN